MLLKLIKKNYASHRVSIFYKIWSNRIIDFNESIRICVALRRAFIDKQFFKRHSMFLLVSNFFAYVSMLCLRVYVFLFFLLFSSFSFRCNLIIKARNYTNFKYRHKQLESLMEINLFLAHWIIDFNMSDLTLWIKQLYTSLWKFNWQVLKNYVKSWRKIVSIWKSSSYFCDFFFLLLFIFFLQSLSFFLLSYGLT